MIRCCFAFAVAAMCAVLVGAGCSDRSAPLIAEIDEPLYVAGVQLNKQGRNGEALTSFLKVIERRADRGAPESHLEVGVIYLNHAKDPVLAYYHFKRYLELQPNSKEAPRVRGMLDAALRDIAKRFPGRPAEDQSVRLAAAEENAKLRRENDELRAELQTLRGGGARAVRMVSLPDEARARATPAPPEVAVNDAAIIPAPAPSGTRSWTPPAQPAGTIASRPSVPSSNVGRLPPPSGRTHTVLPKQTLYAISKQYNVRMEDLARINGITNPSNVPVGTVLRIP